MIEMMFMVYRKSVLAREQCLAERTGAEHLGDPENGKDETTSVTVELQRRARRGTLWVEAAS